VTSIVGNDGRMYVVGRRKKIDKVGSILMMCIGVTDGDCDIISFHWLSL
jgi:hypothetical protein